MTARATLLVVAALGLAAAAGAWWLVSGSAGPADGGTGRVLSPAAPAAEPALVLPAPGAAPAALPAAGGGVATQPERLAAAGPPTTSTVGRVVSRAGTPVPGAEVAAFVSLPGDVFRSRSDLGAPVASGADGRFEFLGLPADQPLGVEVSSGAYAPVLREPFVVEAGAPHDLGDLVLEEGLTLLGTVTGPDGEPLPDAVVNLADLQSRQRGGRAAPVRSARTDTAGAYAFPHLALRQYSVEVLHDGYGPVTIVLSLVLGTASGEWRQDFRLEHADSTLLGRFIDGRERPVADTPVTLSQRQRGQNTFVLREARTDADGRFAVSGLAAGAYDVSLQSRDFYLDQPLSLEADGEEHLIRVLPALAVLGRLRCSGAVPDSFDVRVRIDGRSGAGLLGGAEVLRSYRATQPAGSFRFDGLRPGSYRFEVRAPGFAVTTSADVILGTDVPETDLIVDLLRGGTLRGRLAPPEAGARIELRGNDYDPALGLEGAFPTPPVHGLVAATGADGSFTLEHVPPGDYALTALPGAAPPIQVRNVAVADETVTDLGTLRVVEGGVLYGSVLGPDGRPRAGVRVSATTEQHQQQAVTDAGGSYRLVALPPGTYELLATPGNLWEALQFEARQHVTLAAGQEVPVQLTLLERSAEEPAPR